MAKLSKEFIGKHMQGLQRGQQNGEIMLCPRCGLHELDPKGSDKALSRRMEIYVCSTCGTSEAMEDMFGIIREIPQWHAIEKFNY